MMTGFERSLFFMRDKEHRRTNEQLSRELSDMRTMMAQMLELQRQQAARTPGK